MNAFAVWALDGDRAWIKPARPRPTILYVFTPECGWCATNYDAVRARRQRR